MKRVSVAILALLGLVACGGNSNTSPIRVGTNRAFVTNAQSGIVEVYDTTTDSFTSFVQLGDFRSGAQPTFMALSPQREITAVFNAFRNQVFIVKNSDETLAGGFDLPGETESIVLKDSTAGFAAVRNASVNGIQQPGAVVKMDISTFAAVDCSATTRSYCVSVPLARAVVLSPDGNKLLVFSDNSNSVTIIDTTKFADAAGRTVVGGFDRPVGAVFSSDSSKAYVLNCGPECGGTTASVQVLNVASDVTQSTIGTEAPVSAATTALLSGSTLFVAGSPDAAMGPAAGRLNAFDVSSGVPVPSSTVSNVPISDGYHTRMVLASSNKLFIGSRNCTNNPGSATPTGCLTIFDTSANTARIDTAADATRGTAKGSVTGMAPIANRNAVYVVAGGELRVYDTTTSTESTQRRIEVIGQAVDVKTVDQ